VKISVRLFNTVVKALSQSMTVAHMETLAQKVIPKYDLHRRSGFPPSIPIPQLDAAEQVTMDMRDTGLFVRFVEVLMTVHENGLMGRPLSIRFLRDVIREVEAMGYSYDAQYGMFVEGDGIAKTRSWGILREGDVYELSFLRLDIVGNSRLVREYPDRVVRKAYTDLRSLCQRIVERRGGRIWHWEGDGGLAAFYYNDKNFQATLAGMDLIYDLVMYNLFECPFESLLTLRIAVHTGPCQYRERSDDVQSETLKRLKTIESKHTLPGTLTISASVYTDLGQKLEQFFTPIDSSRSNNNLYRYAMRWE
jgi:class 3 adenylate cyclase